MGFLDIFKKNNADLQKRSETSTVQNEPSKMLSVEEATGRLYKALAEYTGWKFLKSQRCLKKTIDDLVFEVNFSTSQWNKSFDTVYVYCEFSIWCKKFDKISNGHSTVGYYKFEPLNDYWHDISDEKKLSFAIERISNQMSETILPLCKAFEEDFSNGVILLTEEDNFKKYHISLRFLDIYAGREYVYKLAQNYINSLSYVCKQDIEKYKQGDRSKPWMINPSKNLKYIIDNDLLDKR
jgi:hypothetical protein